MQLLTDLYGAYYIARSNKRNTYSQVRFERHLADNVLKLYEEIIDGSYRPGRSMCFIVDTPVKREIFAATFRDRIVHHLIFNKLNPVFEPTFIFDSYSCRKQKGTHLAINRMQHHIRSCSRNGKEECYVLRLDIKGYFMNINRAKLYELISERVNHLFWQGSLPWASEYDIIMPIVKRIVFLDSTRGCRMRSKKTAWNGLPKNKSLFYSKKGCGLPIGNLTSQLFSNIYLNVLDNYVKRDLKFEHYGRYVDDAYVVDSDYDRLLAAIPIISNFLKSKLGLDLNSNKTKIIPAYSGVGFLGTTVFPYSVQPLRSTVRRIRKGYEDALSDSLDEYCMQAKINSYKSYLAHFSETFNFLR